MGHLEEAEATGGSETRLASVRQEAAAARRLFDLYHAAFKEGHCPDIAEWAKELDTILRAGSAQQRKALLRTLIKELRVMSRELILPTYKSRRWFAHRKVKWR